MAEIFAAPRFSKATACGRDVVALDLQTALNKARPGDTITLLPGVYRDPVTVTRGGAPGLPVTLRAGAPRSVAFDGGRAPRDGLLAEPWPNDGHWSFVKMFDVAHVVIEGVDFRNCWPHAIYLRGCADLSFRDIEATGGRHVVFARNGDADGRQTRRLLLERIRWVQDPDRDMWEGRASWSEVKGKVVGSDKSWFNGAFFGSYDIPGDVTIRACDVSHAFNAIRMDIDPARVDRDEQDRPIVSRNRNVRILDCRFSWIRDNAVEPERGLQGWLVAGNRFFQVHAALSLDGVTIRDFAFVANRFLNLSRPVDAGNSSGKIVKFLGRDDRAAPGRTSGFVTAFNSARTRAPYAADARPEAWTDLNNAVERFASERRDSTVLLANVALTPKTRIDGLATNDPLWPAAYAEKGANAGGWPALERVFAMEDPDPIPALPLGGWDGELPLGAAAQQLAAIGVTLRGPEGRERHVAPDGLRPGFQPLAALGLADWAEPPAAALSPAASA